MHVSGNQVITSEIGIDLLTPSQHKRGPLMPQHFLYFETLEKIVRCQKNRNSGNVQIYP